jgi:hypothetical protein
MKEIEPTGLYTGLQELLAMRIHLARDHGTRKTMQEVMELRADEEGIPIEPKGIIRINVDRNERWLS